MNLHVEDFGGTGAPLLFIHGWGMHGGMWGDVLTELAQQYRVLVVDLPGHGNSRIQENRRVDTSLCPRGLSDAWAAPAHPTDVIVDQLAAQFSEPLTVCGWSLGGQIALHWAQRFPAQVTRLVLVSSTPCFVQRSDWTCAMEGATLAAFSATMQQNYLQTLRRFLSLQLRGSEQERELLAVLRGSLLSRGEPDLVALQAGLEILRDSDQRADLSQISQPALVIAGERDTLTPLAASQFMAEQLPNAQLATIAGAAHAPFLSHPAIFVQHLMSFLHG